MAQYQVLVKTFIVFISLQPTQIKSQLGVIYSPFVKPDDTPSFTNWYTQKDVKVMLKLLVDDKINYIATSSVGAPDETYVPNESTKRCSSAVHTALAAAEINKEKNQNTITVFQGLNNHARNIETEIDVGFEVAYTANSIYPGTVSAIIFPSYEQFDDLLQISGAIQETSLRAKKHNLRFGMRIRDCDIKIPRPENKKSVKEILKICDFIICKNVHFAIHTNSSKRLQKNEHRLVFSRVEKGVLNVENTIQEIGLKTQVILETGWPSVNRIGSGKENQQMRRYWEHVDRWANNKKRMVFMHEAFDSPWRESWTSNYGLYTHLNMSDNSEKAYKRKFKKFDLTMQIVPSSTTAAAIKNVLSTADGHTGQNLTPETAACTTDNVKYFQTLLAVALVVSSVSVLLTCTLSICICVNYKNRRRENHTQAQQVKIGQGALDDAQL